MNSDNPTGADNQQETAELQDPQRLHARHPCPAELVEGEDTVRPSWRHEELGRNDLAAQS